MKGKKQVKKIKEEKPQEKPQKKLRSKSEGAQKSSEPNDNLNGSYEDSSDEEVRARIGRVPLKWYENYKHIGYDVNAKKVAKAEQRSKLEEIRHRGENPNWWRAVRDELNGKDIILTDEQLDLLQKIRTGRIVDQQAMMSDFQVEFNHPDFAHPMDRDYEPKRRFVPSKWERIKINKMVHAIRMGWLKVEEDQMEEKEPMWDLWEHEHKGDDLNNLPPPLEATKVPLPGHAESYNPAPEYLMTPEEEKEWKESHPEDREMNFLPKKVDCLRHVGPYENIVQERFERLMDLYLAPRLQKKKLKIDPKSLLDELPNIQELRPFPSQPNIYYKGHESRVRCLRVSRDGELLATGDQSGKLIIWDVTTSRILRTFKFESAVYHLEWSGNGFLVAAIQEEILFFNLGLTNEVQFDLLEEVFKESQQSYSVSTPELPWEFSNMAGVPQKLDMPELRLKIQFKFDTRFVTVHSKNDYVASVSSTRENKNQVFVHSLAKGVSQRPFLKAKAGIQKVSFHPTKSIILLLCEKHIYVYDLKDQAMKKKLISGAKMYSSMCLHPRGDNVIAGTYDRRVLWFDLDLGKTPYKTFKFHKRAVRAVDFHPANYPLMATAADDGSVHIFHSMVYADLMENALIVPLKILKGHQVLDDLGVLDVQFHPTQPWIFSCGADHKVILWT